MNIESGTGKCAADQHLLCGALDAGTVGKLIAQQSADTDVDLHKFYALICGVRGGVYLHNRRQRCRRQAGFLRNRIGSR